MHSEVDCKLIERISSSTAVTAITVFCQLYRRHRPLSHGSPQAPWSQQQSYCYCYGKTDYGFMCAHLLPFLSSWQARYPFWRGKPDSFMYLANAGTYFSHSLYLLRKCNGAGGATAGGVGGQVPGARADGGHGRRGAGGHASPPATL